MDQSLTIMVVDDSRTNAFLVTRMLVEDGHNVVQARDADEALSLLREYPEIQLLVIDWVLPTMQGPELAQTVRQRYAEPYRYIIMQTAKSGHENMVAGLGSGVDDYMEKPVDQAELRARIKIATRIINLEGDLKRKLQEIDTARREWEATTNAVAQLICLINANCEVRHANQTVQNWDLSSQAAAVGPRLDALLARRFPDFAAQFRVMWPRMRVALIAGQMFEFEGVDERSSHYFAVQLQPIRHGQDQPAQVDSDDSFAAVTIQDITESKMLALQLQDANEKSEQLLLNILPAAIADRLRAGESQIADSYDEVTVMFADLVGFTRMASSITPGELMTALNEVFSAFDTLSEKYNVEKIKTIGDAYLVVGGLPTPRADHVSDMADMALEMLSVIKRIRETSGYPLDLRIGMATGPVVAGVIGRKKFVYDLWGDTVNTAYRMESNGVAGAVQVTQHTADRLGERYELEARGEIDLKGKGPTPAFLLRGKVAQVER